jgi:uncharacterized protein YjiS (DUF1127 family)
MSAEHEALSGDTFDGEQYPGSYREVSSLLDAADSAFKDGQGRLAIHLYCAAFEMEQQGSVMLSGRVLDGLRRAWDLACDLGDRPAAEELFGLLAPHNTLEQTEQGILRLQGLASRQLEDMGISTDDLKDAARAFSQESLNDAASPLLDSIRSALEHLRFGDIGEAEATGAVQHLGSVEIAASVLPDGQGLVSLEPSGAAPSATSGATGASSAPTQQRQPAREHRLDYGVLAGYHDAIGYMRRFGFIPADLKQAREFVERASRLHGVFGLSLSEPFLFHGPSRGDVGFFAHATAGEIGWPVLHIDVEMEADGSGMIKLAGPFKRGFLGGPPDIMELETPCIVLLENVDHLQQMFGSEDRPAHLAESHGRMPHGRSLRGEITGYLRALLRKPGVFLIATAAAADSLREPLRSVIGAVHTIAIEAPTVSERHEVWERFASDHPSLMRLDLAELAHLSEGVSRHDIVMAGHGAVEKAYRESLRSGELAEVDVSDLLFRLASLVDHESEAYRQLEDAAVAELSRLLEQDFSG